MELGILSTLHSHDEERGRQWKGLMQFSKVSEMSAAQTKLVRRQLWKALRVLGLHRLQNAWSD